MTDNEIVKALECCMGCDCKECHYHNEVDIADATCKDRLVIDALKLVNRQKDEIDRLADRNHKCIYLSDDETTEFCVDGPCPKFKTEKQIRANAIKAFAVRLMENAKFHYDYYANICIRYVEVDAIDNLVKEMVGETV